MNPAEATLLLVDDNEDNRYALSRRLQREGYVNLASAADGHQAMDLLGKQAFDLVLLDVMMPGLNGYEVLERMRADSQLRHIPVIMISALEEIESVIRCVELGAEDYLAKPFNATLLRARVGASLEKKRLRDEVRTSLERLERELNAARELQLGMLPSTFPDWSAARPVEVHAFMEPAREVGGDLYDFFFATEGVCCFLVGDVSGKGAPAAMFMARTRSLVRLAVGLWRKLGGDEASPAQIAETVNQELCQDNRDRMFVTLLLGFLDTRSGVVAFINAGHPQPNLMRSDGTLETTEDKPDAPLGVRRDTRYRNRTATLRAGDALFVCTDGVAEAMNVDGDLYGNERLEAQLRAVIAETPAAIIRGVKEHLDGFAGAAPRADDVTMLALRWLPAPDRAGTPSSHEPGESGLAVAGAGPLPGKPSNNATIVIRNDLAELTRVSGALERLGEQHGIDPKALNQLQVALDEMVSNVIRHGVSGLGERFVEVGIAVREGEVKLAITDDGRPFDPTRAPPPAPPLPGQRPKPGGIGIHMVKQLMDEMQYERVGDRNRLTLIKRCAMGAPPR